MRVEWVILAEGLGQDSKGAITAIGLNQNVLVAPSFPVSTKRAVVAHLVDYQQHLKVGDKINLRFSATSPSGKVIAAQSVQAAIGQPPPWPDLPANADMPAEMILTFYEYGTHRIEVSVQSTGVEEEITGGLDFYVVKPSDLKGGAKSDET